MRSISFNGAPEVKFSSVSPDEVKDFEHFIQGLSSLQDNNFPQSGAIVVSVKTEREYNVDIVKLENLLCKNPQAQFLEKGANFGTFELIQEARAEISVKEAIAELRKIEKIQTCNLEKIVEGFEKYWEKEQGNHETDLVEQKQKFEENEAKQPSKRTTRKKTAPTPPPAPPPAPMFHHTTRAKRSFYVSAIEDTLFPERTEQINLKTFQNLLSGTGKRFPGINTPYIYVGGKYSIFGLHIEDVDLFSINFLHKGASKLWIIIVPKEMERLEEILEKVYGDSYSACRNAVSHKAFYLSIKLLKEYGIKFNIVIQEPGEYMIINPGAYHQGFNLGCNVAEAVNFATSHWFSHGLLAQKRNESKDGCKCKEQKENNCTLADFLNQLILEYFKKLNKDQTNAPFPSTSNESNHQVEAEEPSSKKKKRKRKNKDQTNAPFPSTSNESNHQVETENPSSKKKKRKHNRSSKLSIEKKRLREADKLRGKIENGTKYKLDGL